MKSNIGPSTELCQTLGGHCASSGSMTVWGPSFHQETGPGSWTTFVLSSLSGLPSSFREDPSLKHRLWAAVAHLYGCTAAVLVVLSCELHQHPQSIVGNTVVPQNGKGHGKEGRHSSSPLFQWMKGEGISLMY